MAVSHRSQALALVIAFLATFASPSDRSAVGRTGDSNVVIEWNQTMLSAFATANVAPPPANRLGAIVQSAVFDAVNGIERGYTPVHVQPAAPAGASARAAAAAAAYRSLVAFFPAQKASLDAALASSLVRLRDEGEADESTVQGLAWGKAVADAMVAWRAADGFSAPAPSYVFGTAPGVWQPTPGGSGAPKFQQLATTTPFALTSPSQFRPAGPPPLNSARYAASFAEVKALGGETSAARTAYQTETARFWQLDTPVAMWDRVADSLSLQHHLNLLKTARVLALVNVSIADALIATWDAKVTFNSWRPVTAIAHADVDGNADTSADPAWLPLMVTPYFQEYPSAHSATSGAAAMVLATEFGANAEFTVTSAGLPGVRRSFDSFADAVSQVADARVFAGFHFRFACDDAITLGGNVGAFVEGMLLLPVKTDDSDRGERRD